MGFSDVERSTTLYVMYNVLKRCGRHGALPLAARLALGNTKEFLERGVSSSLLERCTTL